MEPLAVDIREAGRLLSLSSRTIRRHIRSGRIKAVRVGRRVLVPVKVLTEMVKPSDGSLSAARGSLKLESQEKVSGQ
jgi:excisionase family DNA binding protein